MKRIILTIALSLGVIYSSGERGITLFYAWAIILFVSLFMILIKKLNKEPTLLEYLTLTTVFFSGIGLIFSDITPRILLNDTFGYPWWHHLITIICSAIVVISLFAMIWNLNPRHSKEETIF